MRLRLHLYCGWCICVALHCALLQLSLVKVALKLASKNVNIALTFNKNRTYALELVKRLESEFGVHAACYQSQNGDYDSVSAVVDIVCRQFEGGIHTMVYSSGPHADYVRPLNYDPDGFLKIMKEDVAGFFNMCHACVPKMMRQEDGSGGNGGAIVAITTCATEKVIDGDFISAVPKAAVRFPFLYFFCVVWCYLCFSFVRASFCR